MLVKNHPFVVGYVTSLSNEVNMLKSIQRFARDISARWMMVYLKMPDEVIDNPSGLSLNIQVAQDMCASLGGQFLIVDTAAQKDFLKLHLFAISVDGHHVQRILIDNSVAKSDVAKEFFSQLQDSLEANVDYINIESKNTFLTNKRRPLLRGLQKAQTFFVRTCADIVIGLLYGLFTVLLTYSLHYTLNYHWAPVDDSYTYMIFILFANLCALQAGIWGGVMCILVTSLSANYFFIEPYYQFKLNNFSDVMNWLTLVIASSVTSVISALMVTQSNKSRQEEKNLSLLLDINTTPLKHKNITMLLQDLKNRLKEHLKTEIVFFVPTLLNDNKLELFTDGMSGEAEIAETEGQNLPDREIVEQLWLDMKQGYIHAYQVDPVLPWVYLPLSTIGSDVGVLAVHKPMDSQTHTQDVFDYKKLSDMIAVILEYINLDQETHARDIMKEKDKLRTHILSSVSHDLKTPLASIIGSLGLYLSSSLKLKEAQIKALIENAYSEANRLDGFITNILTMTKLEAGLIKFRKEQIRPQQLLSMITDKIKWKLPDERLDISHLNFRDIITVDVAATDLVISNLLDNALRHSPPDETISLDFINTDNGYSLTISNKGMTIPADEIDAIFDKYARLQREDSQQAATGLGLALCRGLMQGQGGDINVRNVTDGVAFTISWPDA